MFTVHLIFGTDLSCMSESRRKAIMIWCLGLATKGTEVCTAGICAGNSSGNCKSTAVFSFPSLAWHWFSFQQARGAGLIFLFFPPSSSLIQSRGELLGSGVAETRCLRPHRQLQVNSASVCELSATVCRLCFLTPALFHSCQAVQEEGAGESCGAVRVQRIRLSDGDDRPCQTAQLHHWRSEALILSLFTQAHFQKNIHLHKPT